MAAKSNNSKAGRKTGVSKNTKKKEASKGKEQIGDKARTDKSTKQMQPGSDSKSSSSRENSQRQISKAGERDLDRNQDERYGDDTPRRLSREDNHQQDENVRGNDRDTDSRGNGNRNNGNRNNSHAEDDRSRTYERERSSDSRH